MTGDIGSTPGSSYPTPASVYGQFERSLNEIEPAIIDEQIRYGLDVEAQGGNFFNNFTCNLPGGLYRRLIQGKALQRMVGNPGDFDAARPLSYSERATGVTFEQFFADVDRAVAEAAEAGLDLQRLEELRSKSDGRRGTWEDRCAYTYYALPVYRSLRMQGYSHGDLMH